MRVCPRLLVEVVPLFKSTHICNVQSSFRGILQLFEFLNWEQIELQCYTADPEAQDQEEQRSEQNSLAGQTIAHDCDREAIIFPSIGYMADTPAECNHLYRAQHQDQATQSLVDSVTAQTPHQLHAAARTAAHLSICGPRISNPPALVSFLYQ